MRPCGNAALTRTRLIATLGPALAPPGQLEALLDAGVDLCRLNFSHGELEGHRALLERVRAWAGRHDRPVAVLGDLCGPKIRLNAVRGGTLELCTGERVGFVRGGEECEAGRLTTTYAKFVDEVQVGHRIYIDDGLVRLLATDVGPDAVVAAVTAGGRIASRKGVNLPDTRISAPALTEKDRGDLGWAIEHDLDYVGLSFVRRPADLLELRDILDGRGSRAGVIVKIEKAEALEHLDQFVAGADGVMVARGDLGVEMDVWQVPLIQKAIVARCRQAGKPVIVATQMLQSMVSNPTPTRAEVSDIANAILESVDAVMLSAETATGQFPLLAVEMMQRVARAAEGYRAQFPADQPATSLPTTARCTSAIASAAVQAARQLDAKLVAVWTATGETVRLVAQQRLPMPVVGLTYDERVWRRLNLLYGVVPIHVPVITNPLEMMPVLDARVVDQRLASPGDLIVVVTSTRPQSPGATDTVLVRRIGEPGDTPA